LITSEGSKSGFWCGFSVDSICGKAEESRG
jgi:hypothetical protein